MKKMQDLFAYTKKYLYLCSLNVVRTHMRVHYANKIDNRT